jgi:hypothetical protein
LPAAYVLSPEDEYLTPEDPTDQALAAIASIRGNDDTSTAAETSDSEPEDALPVHDDSPMHSAEPESDDSDEMFTGHEVAAHDAPATAPEPETEPAAIEGYSRLGPGPLDAIRFRWTARRDDDGRYFVDETIGGSRPISTGPMPADEVVGFIDAQERAARERFNALRSEMTIPRSDRPERADVADDERLSSDH